LRSGGAGVGLVILSSTLVVIGLHSLFLAQHAGEGVKRAGSAAVYTDL